MRAVAVAAPRPDVFTCEPIDPERRPNGPLDREGLRQPCAIDKRAANEFRSKGRLVFKLVELGKDEPWRVINDVVGPQKRIDGRHPRLRHK